MIYVLVVGFQSSAFMYITCILLCCFISSTKWAHCNAVGGLTCPKYALSICKLAGNCKISVRYRTGLCERVLSPADFCERVARRHRSAKELPLLCEWAKSTRGSVIHLSFLPLFREWTAYSVTCDRDLACESQISVLSGGEAAWSRPFQGSNPTGRHSALVLWGTVNSLSI